MTFTFHCCVTSSGCSNDEGRSAVMLCAQWQSPHKEAEVHEWQCHRPLIWYEISCFIHPASANQKHHRYHDKQMSRYVDDILFFTPSHVFLNQTRFLVFVPIPKPGHDCCYSNHGNNQYAAWCGMFVLVTMQMTVGGLFEDARVVSGGWTRTYMVELYMVLQSASVSTLADGCAMWHSHLDVKL